MGCAICKVKNQKKLLVERRRSTEASLTIENFIRVSSLSRFDDYETISSLDKGSFSNVMLCKHIPTGQRRAVKIIRKFPLNADQLNPDYGLTEMAILRQLDHPNIIKTYEIFEDKNCFYLPLEYCEGGNLQSKLQNRKTLPESLVAEIIYQLLLTIAYIHEKNIVHKDIKLENILLESDKGWNIKLADFGNAAHLERNALLNDNFFTPEYTAPEALKGPYREKIDIWSCGIILYILITGDQPYNKKSSSAIRKEIIDNPFKINNYTFNNQGLLLTDFAKGLLEINPDTRLSAKKALYHPWLTYTRSNTKPSLSLPKVTFPSHKSKLAKGIMIYILTCLVKSPDNESLSNLFRLIDKNRNGIIEKFELERELNKTHSERESEELVKVIFEEYDLNKSGTIEFSEFLIAFSDNKKYMNRELIGLAFDKFDRGRKGKINLKDIESVIGTLESDAEENRLVRNAIKRKKCFEKDEFVDFIENLS